MCHLFFDARMEISRKYRMVVNGAITEVPSSLTYYYVVSRDSICLDVLIFQLNDLYIILCDVRNEYLNAPCQDNIWFTAGP